MRTMRDPLHLGITILALLIATAFPAARPAKAQQGQITLRLGHVYPPDSPGHAAAELLRKIVDTKLGGRIKIELFPAGQLGQERDLITSAASGASIALISTGALESRSPSLAIFHAPFAFNSREDLLQFQRGNGGQALLRSQTPWGLVGLGYYTIGSYQFWGRTSILDQSDFKGLKVAILGPPDARLAVVLERLGAQPSRMPPMSIVGASANRTIDAAEISLATGDALGIHQQFTRISLTNHRFATMMLVAAQRLLDSMPMDIRSAFEQAVQESADAVAQEVAAKEGAILQRLRGQGVEIRPPSDTQLQWLRSAFRPDQNSVGGPLCQSPAQACKNSDNKCVCENNNSCTKC
jgi:TRAP-type C4-dicarboxylate transport system substrate-binding protein